MRRPVPVHTGMALLHTQATGYLANLSPPAFTVSGKCAQCAYRPSN